MNIILKTGLKILGGVLGVLGLNEIDKRCRYIADGYNRLGYDRDGFDRNGFDRDGYDRQGFDADGFDRDGYDSEGYNASGFDKHGYNRDGLNVGGYDRDGFDIEGYNLFGYDQQGYKKDGTDCCGYTKAYYEQKATEMEENGRTAHEQMKEGHFAYALRDIRVGIEKGIKGILAHKLGKGYEDNRLDFNIGICARHKLFDQDFIDKLYSAKIHCNDTAHDDYEKTYGQVHFSYKVLEEVIAALRQMTCI